MLFEKLYNVFFVSKVETTITSEMKQHPQGRAQWMAAQTKWAGSDSWNTIISKNREIYENLKFTGTGQVYSLWKHVAKFKVAFFTVAISKQATRD